MPENGMNGQQKQSGLSWTAPSQTQRPPQSAPQMPMVEVQTTAAKSSTPKIIGAFVAGVIICALVIWGFATARSGKNTVAQNQVQNTASTIDENSSTNAANIAGIAVSTNTTAVENSSPLVIASPQQAGLEVVVTKAAVSQPTWVVIYENRAGVPGNALGAALFTSERQSGVVDLLRGTLPGQSYLAGEALDDGDHKFSLENDKPVRDANGNPLWIEFRTN